MIGNLTRYTTYIANIQAIDAAVAKRMGEVAMDITNDRPEILEFYKALRDEFALWLSEE
jgi:hypothetical protein